MDANQALDFVNDLLRKRGFKDLNHAEGIIFREAWENPLKDYDSIPCSQNYSENSLRTIAYSLWKRLGEVFEVRVQKNKLRTVVEEYKRKQDQLALEQGTDSVAEIGIASLENPAREADLSTETLKEQLLQEIEQAPDSIVEEILDFCLFID